MNLEIQQAAHKGLELFDQGGIRVGNGLSELCEDVIAFGGKRYAHWIARSHAMLLKQLVDVLLLIGSDSACGCATHVLYREIPFEVAFKILFLVLVAIHRE